MPLFRELGLIIWAGAEIKVELKRLASPPEHIVKLLNAHARLPVRLDSATTSYRYVHMTKMEGGEDREFETALDGAEGGKREWIMGRGET